MSEDHLEFVFASALEKLSVQDRVAFLEQACAGDPVLRGRAEALLRAHERAGSFLHDQPWWARATTVRPSLAGVVGTRLARDKLGQPNGQED
jgi:hypothetical protein